MSWEEVWKREVSCPCGKGKIIKITYGDDWNRYNDKVQFQCDECSNKYKIEEVIHNGRLTSDGSWSEYFLTPRDYPKYVGISEISTYGIAANPNSDFTGWLIENFTETELISSTEQLCEVKASSKLKGTAAIISREHKKALRTIKVNRVLASVEKAIGDYSNYKGNKLQRTEIRNKEMTDRAKYAEKKFNCQIPLSFN